MDSVTANEEKMLDSKLANVIKPVNEVAEKLDGLIERMEAEEQRVSDLEDMLATTGSGNPAKESTETPGKL